MELLRSFLVVSALLVGISAAWAQDGSEGATVRSPENAQRFLATVAERYPLEYSASDKDQTNTTWYELYKNLKFTSTDKCHTTIDGILSTAYLNGRDGNPIKNRDGTTYLMQITDPNEIERILADNSDLVTFQKMPLAPISIDWSTITQVKEMRDPNNNGIYDEGRWTTITAGNKKFHIRGPSNELATRMRLAMETLRTACDTTGGLGF